MVLALLLVVSSVPSISLNFLPWTLLLLSLWKVYVTKFIYFLPLALISALSEIVMTLANQHSTGLFCFFLTFYFDFWKSCETNTKNPRLPFTLTPQVLMHQHICLIVLSLPVCAHCFPSSVCWAELPICVLIRVGLSVCLSICLSIHVKNQGFAAAHPIPVQYHGAHWLCSFQIWQWLPLSRIYHFLPPPPLKS